MTNTTSLDLSIARIDNGRAVTWREVTTEDLLVSATRYACPLARKELSRRGIDWKAYAY